MTDFSTLMSSLFDMILGWTNAALTWLYNLFIDLLQSILDLLVTFALSIVAMFPAGSAVPSFGSTPDGPAFNAFLNALNWFFPISYLVTIVTFLVGAMIAYFVIAPVARWVKLLT